MLEDFQEQHPDRAEALQVGNRFTQFEEWVNKSILSTKLKRKPSMCLLLLLLCFDQHSGVIVSQLPACYTPTGFQWIGYFWKCLFVFYHYEKRFKWAKTQSLYGWKAQLYNVHLENCVCRSRLQIFCGCEVHLTCANAAALSSFSCQAFSIFSEAFNKHRWHIRTHSAAVDMVSKEGKQVGRERSQMP